MKLLLFYNSESETYSKRSWWGVLKLSLLYIGLSVESEMPRKEIGTTKAQEKSQHMWAFPGGNAMAGGVNQVNSGEQTFIIFFSEELKLLAYPDPSLQSKVKNQLAKPKP